MPGTYLQMFAFEYLVSALACKYLMSAVSIPMCPKAPLKMGLEWSSLWIFGTLMWLGLSARPLTMSSHQTLEGRCSLQTSGLERCCTQGWLE